MASAPSLELSPTAMPITERVLPPFVKGVTFRWLGRDGSHHHEFDERLPGGLQTIGLVLRPPETELSIDGSRVMHGRMPVGSFVIPPGARIAGHHRGEQDFIDILFEPDGLAAVVSDMSIDVKKIEMRPIYLPADSQVTSLAHRLRTAFALIPRIDSLYLDTLLQSCLSVLIQRHATSFESRVRSGPSLSPATTRAVMEYVSVGLDTQLRLEDLAAVAKLSRAHFARAFRNSVGVTPHLFVLQRRLERAIFLLARTSMPISVVAATTGFADHAHLARTFKRFFGVPPSCVRE